ncbi:excitatory amino acid transporter-like [Pomacea canaliculata]|uniref:excitatory amino acid transporter-like n=1 Tax=Pomacea canaliculata TaxID=400727 RepID=UPI000D72796C|nr:excitatory amino acid transporter-like [Pomacea canaliculata]
MTLDRKDWCSRRCCRNFLCANLLVLLTTIFAVVGFALGAGVRTLQPSLDAIVWIGLPGEVYMRMLKMMILPLIICSVITGTASLDPKCNGKISVVALTYIVVTNSLACLVGIAVTCAIKPALQSGVKGWPWEVEQSVPLIAMDTADIFADLIRNIFPDNIVAASFQQAQTKYNVVEKRIRLNSSGEALNETLQVLRVKGVGTTPSTNILGLVLCCLVFGMATASVGTVGRPFFQFFFAANEIILRILRWFVWATPLGVASLIAVAVMGMGDLASAVRSLGMFCLTVVTSLLVYQLLVVPAFFFLLIRKNPYSFLLTLGRPWMVSFAAASSAMAIPETLQSLEHVTHIDRRVTRFVVPLATSINRDGSCIFLAVSCIFIAHISDVELGAAGLVLLWVLTTVVSLAIPSVPSAGLVAVLINLTALNVPTHAIGLLFATEWIIDRLRSASNMLSHAYCAMTTFVLCQSSLPPEDHDAGDDVVMEINLESLGSLRRAEAMRPATRLLQVGV